MFLGKEKSIEKLRLEAGHTIETASDALRKLTPVRIGKRDKYRSADIAKLIAEANEPTPAPIDTDKGGKFRPLSEKMKARIRAHAGRV